MGSPFGAGEVSEVLGEDDYVCTLPMEVRKLAARDLIEDDNTRTAALQQMRLFVRRNQAITKCRLDGNFLLRFLRMKKFRLRESQELLEKYLKMRVDQPHWFTRLDVRDPTLDRLISTGYFFALPERDDSGRRVFFSVAGKMDPTQFTTSDQMRSMQIGFESLLEDEENQVRGFTYIFDEKDVGLSLITLWSPSDVTKAFQCCEKTIPMRHKEIHILNLPTALFAVFEFAKTLLSDKIKNRFQARLRKNVPLRILPKEYGGTVPMADMIQMYKKELLAVRGRVLMLDHMNINKKPKTKKIEKAINTIQRNFRKLDID
ncbi:Alpha-tocopherol transfer protein-like 3 [Homarus americanus]|uniref:Alpha-tocopherol transfer protein-like 3 n=1 Tax=Homarus americanus TaxID=6706 RepID=A0A8J5NA95_HOMAM|nr:Alpha-tocopherol transfer protein-like 3 [Homarus americanus]